MKALTKDMKIELAGEKILNIEEIKKEYDSALYEGLKIETENGEILFLIEAEPQCCEDFGAFFNTPDEINYFLGSKILNVELIEIDSSTEDEKDTEEQLEITTNKGVLQYAIYNIHNGYYTHSVKVKILNLEKNFII